MSSTATLALNHLTMLRDESGISDEIIQTRGYRTITNRNDLLALGFAPSQCRVPGLLLPLHTTNDSDPLPVYRPDNPRVIELKRTGKRPDGTYPNKVIKYEIPKGTGTRVDCPPICRPMLADPSIPLWVTEGQKKGDALASHGLCAIALLGVWNWKGKNAFGGTTLLADFDYIAWENRDVRIVFDSDVMTKREVRQALNRFIEHLQRKKASVVAVYLPGGERGRVGVDDWLVEGHTVEQLEALVEAPRPALKAAPATVELLDEAPNRITRPLSLIDGKPYAATWLYCRVTRRETINKAGEVIKHDPPIITNERRLFMVRGDGRVFGEGGDEPLDALSFELHLPEIPPDSKLWSTAGVKAYRAGIRPDAVDVFDRMVEIVDRFLDFNRSLADQKTLCEMMACYALGTWFLSAFNVAGYLWPTGPRGSGKTVALHTVAQLSYLGIVVLAGGSYASLRDLADYGATLAFDDAENLSDPRKSDPDKRALLLAGNRRGSVVSVKELRPDKVWRTRYVNTFCPRLFSAIQLPDNVLASRSVIVPLIRTLDRRRANADPLDYALWPHDRRQLVDDLWALALAHLPTLQMCDALVAAKASLAGRNLDPWRCILAVALWLDKERVKGLWKRMDDLSVAYQDERPDLEKGDMVSLTLKALCHCATSATSATNGEALGFFDTSVETVKETAREIVAEGDAQAKLDWVSSTRIGIALTQMRFEKLPRPGGKGSRRYRIPLDMLEGFLISYGLTLYTSGTSGTSGTVAQPPIQGEMLEIGNDGDDVEDIRF